MGGSDAGSPKRVNQTVSPVHSGDEARREVYSTRRAEEAAQTV